MTTLALPDEGSLRLVPKAAGFPRARRLVCHPTVHRAAEVVTYAAPLRAELQAELAEIMSTDMEKQ